SPRDRRESGRAVPGLVFDYAALAVDGRLEPAVQRIGCRLARLVDLRDHRRRGVVAPAHGTQELLQVGGTELDHGLVEGIANLAAELVVVGEDAVTERLLQLGGRVDQAPVTLP